jgi:hypothetical protein
VLLALLACWSELTNGRGETLGAFWHR